MRTCPVCTKLFEPSFNTMQAVCSPRCARKVPVIQRKAERAATKSQTEAMKTLPTLRKEAQAAFNKFVRERDSGKPCICCGKMPGADALTGGLWDAGHYRSRGSCPELAFDERNCHAQLKRCNRRTWDVAGYRAELVRRIGLAAVEEVEGPHPPVKHTRDTMRAIRDKYRNALRTTP
jgi:hypothetical protein